MLQLIAAIYLVCGLITALILNATLKPYNVRPFKEVLNDVILYGKSPERNLELNMAFKKTGLGFLETVLFWPPMAVAMISDAVHNHNKKKGDK